MVNSNIDALQEESPPGGSVSASEISTPVSSEGTNLAPIIWYKIANAVFEASGNGGGFLGKPYEPNAVIKNDIEFILMERKPGGYRKPPAVAD